MFILNGTRYELGNTLPNKITSCVITKPRFVRVQTTYVPIVKRWLNELVDRLDCEWITYNNILIEVDSISKFRL